MFGRLFNVQFKTAINDRAMVFWTIAFPLILGTLFNFAFSNLNNSATLKPVTVAVIKNEAYKSDAVLVQTVEALATGDGRVLDVREVSDKDAALKLLDDQDISGVIESEDGKPKVTVKGLNDFNETIVKTAVEQSLQTSNAVREAMMKDPAVMAQLSDVGKSSYLKTAGDKDIDRSALYFYTLIGMACMYASFFGVYAANRTEANQSKLGMRLAASPVSKAKALTAALLSSYVIALAGQLILYLYLTQILGVNFGSTTWAVLLVMAIGSLAGIMLGAFVGASSSRQEGRKIDMLLIVIMVCSLLAGMMGTTSLKHMIDQQTPILAAINPVNLISDALYSTYYFGVGERYWLDLALLGVFSIVVAVGAWLASRRKSYASL